MKFTITIQSPVIQRLAGIFLAALRPPDIPPLHPIPSPANPIPEELKARYGPAVNKRPGPPGGDYMDAVAQYAAPLQLAATRFSENPCPERFRDMLLVAEDMLSCLPVTAGPTAPLCHVVKKALTTCARELHGVTDFAEAGGALEHLADTITAAIGQSLRLAMNTLTHHKTPLN